MVEQKIVIKDIRDMVSRKPERRGKTDVRVTYSIDTLRTYTIEIPKEEFSEEKLKEVLQADLKERMKYLGKEYILEV